MKAIDQKLSDAVWDGNLGEARAALDAGADVNTRDRKDWTLLHLAAWRNRPEIAALLLERGADVDAQTKSGSTPLHVAARKGFARLAALLLARGADVNAYVFGITPLLEAEEYRHPNLAALLRKHGGTE